MKTLPLCVVLAALLSACVSAPTPSPATPPRADLLITNARIVDGTGNPWYRGAIAITRGRISGVGAIDNALVADRSIDAKGRIVAPGFIDVHAHVEIGIHERPTADNYVHDGVTSLVTGNCGGSDDDVDAFLKKIDEGTSVNVATLVGHNTVRRQVIGLANRKANADELSAMKSKVEAAMRAGAVGFSTGLIYLPGLFSDTDEVVALAGAAAAYGGLYATHMRNESNKVAEAIREALDVGRRNAMPVQISHFKLSGNANWGRSVETLGLIESARRAGVDVTIDQYPYTASSTSLSALLPDEALDGGHEAARTRIRDASQRKTIAEKILQSARNTRRPSFAYAVVANFAPDPSLNGKSIADINVAMGRSATMDNEVETILDLFLAGNPQMVFHGMSEDDVKRIMAYPFNMIAADGGVQSGRGMPHPRSYGTNARVLGKYVREDNVVRLEEAVRRMTSLPAQRFRLNDRGLLREGFAADIVVFDDQTIADRATFASPHQYPAGIDVVIVNGQTVIEHGAHTGAKPGRSLRGPGYARN
jgi:N-acyl-D-amino-acid deacylase